MTKNRKITTLKYINNGILLLACTYNLKQIYYILNKISHLQITQNILFTIVSIPNYFSGTLVNSYIKLIYRHKIINDIIYIYNTKYIPLLKYLNHSIYHNNYFKFNYVACNKSIIHLYILLYCYLLCIICIIYIKCLKI